MAPRKGKGKAKALPNESEMFIVYGDILQQTEPKEEHEGAILINCGDATEVWLPISAIQFDGERGDTGVAITVPDWLAAQEGLHNGQGKEDSQVASNDDCKATAPQPCRFKAEITSLADGHCTLMVLSGEESREFTFAKDALRFDGDDMVDLQVGYTGIEFLLAWPISVESGLAEFLGVSEHVPAQETPQTEPSAPAALEAIEDEAPKQEAKPYKSKLRTETVRATVELTPEEKNECAKRITDALSNRTELKEKASWYSSKAREAEKEAYKASEIFESGEEERDITCDVIGDFNSMELVYVESEWPYREIQRRPMTDKDRQLLLPIDQPVKPQPEPEAAASSEPEPAETSTEPEEPETVTLYGEILEQRETETVFRVHYGDEANTVAEFTIPNDHIQLPAFGDPYSSEDMITLTRVYAIENEIIAASEEGVASEVSTEAAEQEYHTCKHGDGDGATDCPECSACDEDTFSSWAKADKACASCSHLDAADDGNACESCDDALSNFTPVEHHSQQDSAATAGGVQ